MHITIAVLLLIIGITIMIFSSDLAVKHSVILATLLNISPMVIGVTLVSIGTDISEMINSVISCSLGHGDIDVGDSVGSDLAQLTLVFGIIAILLRDVDIERKNIVILGGCEILSLILIYTVVAKGYFTRLDALLMIGCLPIYFAIIYYSVPQKSFAEEVIIMKQNTLVRTKKYHLLLAVVGFLGVVICSYIIIESVIVISEGLRIPEYFVSFFILAIGTSLPELTIDIKAIQMDEYELAIGDIIGSCIVDSTLSIAIGQFLFPQVVTAPLIIPTILYTICASLIIFSLIIIRKKIDRKAGVIFVLIYFGSYVLSIFL